METSACLVSVWMMQVQKMLFANVLSKLDARQVGPSTA
jgi:hypothetical protein